MRFYRDDMSLEMDPDMRSLRAWYAQYMTHDGEHLTEDSNPIKALESDDLDMNSFEPWIYAIMLGTRVDDGFCGPCRYLLDNWPSVEDFGPRTRGESGLYTGDRWKSVTGRCCNTAEIEASTRMGCMFCAYLLQGLKEHGLLTIFRKIEARLHRLGETTTCYLSIFSIVNPYDIQLDLPNKISTGLSESCQVRMHCSSTNRLAAIAGPNDLKLGPLALASKWLQSCCDTHKPCNDVAKPHLPTRLVSLIGGRPKVILTAEVPWQLLPLRYATLSYCWGKRPFIQLRSDNIAAFTTSLPTKSLTKTFADAFKIASQLAIDYIWIDSLCIIQDDEADWHREAELMHLVYSGSYINIAASAATDVYQGCFLKQPTFSDGFCTKITKDGIQTTLEFTDDDVYDRAITQSHLMTRAWAIQEKILSPRTLHVGDRGVFWDCKESFGSEYLPRLVETHGEGLTGGADHVGSPFFWKRIVIIYSAANLTYRYDKLRALAGMARAVFNITGDDYLSGLWRADIELHLCWYVDGPRLTKKRADCQDPDWTAPSWSWASIDGPVFYRTVVSDEERYAHVFEIGPAPAVGKDFGICNRRVLHMCCSVLVAAQFSDRPVMPPESSGITDSVAVESSDGEVILPIYVDCIDDSCSRRNELMYILPLVGTPEGGGHFGHVKYLMGIVLRKTTGAAGEYCRIGHFDFQEAKAGSRYDNPRQTFRKVMNDVGAATAEAGCAGMVSHSEHPSEKYVITIV